jgi:hypothetical protein
MPCKPALNFLRQHSQDTSSGTWLAGSVQLEHELLGIEHPYDIWFWVYNPHNTSSQDFPEAGC